MPLSTTPSKKQSLCEYFVERKNAIIVGVIGFIVCLVIEGIFLFFCHEWIKNKYFSNEPNIDIKYDTVTSAPFAYDSKGGMHLDYKTDKIINEFYFQIKNKGRGPAKDFIIDIRTSVKELKITEKNIVFEPFGIEDNIRPAPKNNDSNRFYRLIDSFPGGDPKIFISLKFSVKISESDLKYSFISHDRIWIPYKDVINIRNPLSLFDGYPEVVSVAFAQENKNLEKEADLNKLKSLQIGGYYPLVLAQNLFEFLRNKEILTHSEIKEIENMIESFELVSKGASMSGVSTQISNLFRGFSFSRFHEIILNALIKNKILTFEEANGILKISREAGGTKFSDYNVLVLDVEILNHLLRKGFIKRAEGQHLVDNAKAEKDEERK